MNRRRSHHRLSPLPRLAAGRSGVAALVAAGFALAGCGSSESGDSYAAQTAAESVSEIGGAVISGAVSVAELDENLVSAPSRARGWDWSLIASAQAASPVCSTIKSGSCGTGKKISLTFSNCTKAGDPGETWKGIEETTFNAGDCTTAPVHSSVTFTRAYPSGMSQTNASGRTITSDTTAASGWETSVSGGTRFTIDPVAKTRTIQINGVHMVATQLVVNGDHKKLVTIWDRSVSTSAALLYDQANRQVRSGTLTMQHNLNRYSGTVTIQEPLQFAAGQCNPISGTITTTFTGARTGTETLVYQSGDQAQLTDSSGTTRTVSLTHCL